MKIAGLALGATVAVAAVAVILFAFASGGPSAQHGVPGVLAATAAVPSPTPLPLAWPDGLHEPRDGTLQEIACLDSNGDGEVDEGDSPELAGVSVPLEPGACQRDRHADFFVGAPSPNALYSCTAPRPPLLVVAVSSGGSDLLAAKEGESLGLLDIVNAVRAEAQTRSIATQTILATAAIFGAVDYPQTRMEQWLEHDLVQRMDALPCLRTVILGHSHGGVTVTSVTSVLEERPDNAARLYGVAVDRTVIIYDRPASQMPQLAPLLNVFQTNEGWHGVPIDQPNVDNLDGSRDSRQSRPATAAGRQRL